MNVLDAAKMSGFAYIVLAVNAFLVAGLIHGIKVFLKTREKKS